VRDEDHANHDDKSGCKYHIPVDETFFKKMIPTHEQYNAHGHGVENNGKQKGQNLLNRSLMPVEIAAQGKEKGTISLPNQEGDPNSVQEAQLDFPVIEIPHIDHTCGQGYYNAEYGYQYQPKGDIVRTKIGYPPLRRTAARIGRFFFHFRLLRLCRGKIRQ
jgi:hypothetical protein